MSQPDAEAKAFSLSKLDASEFTVKAQADDAYLMVRVADSRAWLHIHALVRAGRPYGYLIDDNFWLLLGDTPLDRYYQNWSVRRTLESAISGASVVLCHSERFKKFLRNFNQNVEVVPAYFDFSCLEGLPSTTDDGGERRIGIVANASRADDLALIVPAIRVIAESAGNDIFFEFFGYIPPELRGYSKIRYFEPIDDYRTFIRAQYSRGWLLGLAPLRENSFSSYKTDNKFREFGGCGIAGIYSDVTVYRESVTDGETGWLVQNTPDAWQNKIAEILDRPELARKVGAAAGIEVKTRYDVDVARRSWVAALRPVLEHKARRWAVLSQRFRTHVHRALSFGRGRFFATAHGWQFGARPPFSQGGFYGASVMFTLTPGDSLDTDLRAPVDGAFRWTLLVATFEASPKGRLTVAVTGDGVDPRTLELKDSEIYDNAPYFLDVTLRTGGAVSICLSNYTDSPLGIYALSPNGSTRFKSSGKRFFGRFVA